MALSDWDCAVWNSDGRPCVGGVTVGNATRLHISKNRVVVDDENLWAEGGEWSAPTIFVAYRNEPGLYEIAGIRILTAEAPQNGVFFLAASGEGVGLRLYGGIGVSGYDFACPDMVRSLCGKYGVSPAKFAYTGGRCSGWTRDTTLPYESLSGEDFDLVWWQGAYQRERAPEEMVYVGVTPETHQAFLSWVEGVVADAADPLRAGPNGLADWLSKVREAGCLRVNQGDCYLTDVLLGPMTDVESSAPGECAKPIVMEWLSTGRRVATSIPYRSHSQWAAARLKLAEKQGFLRPGMPKLARPVAARKVMAPQPRR